jgi:hypothetical protein
MEYCEQKNIKGLKKYSHCINKYLALSKKIACTQPQRKITLKLYTT